MIAAFALAFGQLGDRRILAVLGKSLAVTLLVFAVMGTAISWAVYRALISWGVAGSLSGVVALIALALPVWFLFRLVALAVLQLFGDEVVQAVEMRHYPDRARMARPLGWREELGVGLRGLLRALGYNLLALPFAFLLMATAIGPAILFAAVNAVLLGRELTEMVALRHRNDAGQAPLPGFATRTALGGVVVALLLVPFVNLLAPVLGAAAATHIVHRGRKP